MGCACCKELPNDGLDINTYYEIIKLQEREKITPGEEQWAKITADDDTHTRFTDNKVDWPHYWPQDQEFDNGTMAFRRDLWNHKSVWVDNWKKDWWNFMQTNHLLMSVFTAPKEDEYTRRERAVILLCCSSLFSIVALIAVTVEAKQIELGYAELGVFAWNNLITITGAITVSIIQLYLQCMATCSCYQNDEEVRDRMETWGHITMGFWLLGGVALLIIGIAESAAVGLLHKFFLSFFTQAIMNIVVPTLILTGQYHLMWKGEHKEDGQCKCGDNWEVCYHDYLDYKKGNKLRREWKPKEVKNNLVNTMGNTVKEVAKQVVMAEKKGEKVVVGIAMASVITVKSVASPKTKKKSDEYKAVEIAQPNDANEDKNQLEEHMDLA
eukprot:162052_1